MVRQSINITPKNNDWLEHQVASGEYASKSEVVNDLIRAARANETGTDNHVAARIANEPTQPYGIDQSEHVSSAELLQLHKERLSQSKSSGVSKLTAEERLFKFKETAKKDGLL